MATPTPRTRPRLPLQTTSRDWSSRPPSLLFGDARSCWDAAGLTDPRVVHLWDAEDVSGGWLAANVAGYQGGDWDTYLL